MTRRFAHRAWVAVLPVAAVAMVATASLVPAGSVEPVAPRAVDVVETSYACPAGSAITLAAGQLRAGQDRSVRAAKDGTIDPKLTDPSRWSTASVDAPGVIVTETGRASGPSGYFAGRAPARGGGGLVVGQCSGVIDDAWFLGAGSGDRHFSTLILTNVSSAPAVADILLWGPDGPVDAVDASGVALDPYEVRRVPLADLAAGEPALAVQVLRTRGAMAAVVNDSSTADLAGTEPIGTTRAPTRDQYVGGIVGGDRGKTLLVLNPGESTARLDVEIVAKKGTFAGTGLQDIKIEPGEYREIEVPASTGKGRQAYHLRSDRPLAASARVNANDVDYAVAEASVPLEGEAIVPIAAGSKIAIPELVLTAPGSDATVDVEAFDASMSSLGSSTVRIDGGTTAHAEAVDPQADYADDVAYVVVRASGTVIGASQYEKDDGVSSLALRAAPVKVSAPAVSRADN